MSWLDTLMRSGSLRIVVAVILGGMAGLPARADCRLPPAPNKIPDGMTSTADEMWAAMETLKNYNTDVINYNKCLDFEVRQNRLTSAERDQRHNAAVDALKALADKFNEQVRLFKAKGG